MMAYDASRSHRIAVTIGEKQIDGWTEYEITSSCIEPCDQFTLTRAADRATVELCRTDAEVTITIDGTQILNGFIDRRQYQAREGKLTIAGRDRIGRLVQESIPGGRGYDGLSLVECVKKLAAPWFSKVTLSNARNRAVRRGRGSRAPAGNEPLILPGRGNAGRLDPGDLRWQVIEGLCAQAGLLCWSAADGTELIIGKPNYQQAAQFWLVHDRRGISTVKELDLQDDVGDAYAMIEVHGSGIGDEANYGDAVTSQAARALDGPAADGTGGLFLRPKRILLSQAALRNRAEADRIAKLELARRRFRARTATAKVAMHGQVLSRSTPTLFTPDTVARVTDRDLGLDTMWWCHTCVYRSTRQGGEETDVQLVPVGTEVTQ